MVSGQNSCLDFLNKNGLVRRGEPFQAIQYPVHSVPGQGLEWNKMAEHGQHDGGEEGVHRLREYAINPGIRPNFADSDLTGGFGFVGIMDKAGHCPDLVQSTPTHPAGFPAHSRKKHV